jgi:AraC-like DNA-binding protein
MTLLTFTEFEAFAEAVQDASMEMRITALGEPKWTLQYELAGSLRLQKGYEGGGNVTEGVTLGDAWTFYHQRLPVRANGQVAHANEVFAAPPSADFCLACRPPHAWLTVAIPASELFSTEQELEFADSAKPQVLKPPPGATRRFASLVERFLSAAERRPQLLDAPVAVDCFQSELVAAAKKLFQRVPHVASRHFVRWYSQTKSTLEIAMSHPDQSQALAALARQDGVPERTLRTAFQRCYGLSPLEYLRIHRLHQARQRLRASCPDESTVTQIACGLGFWDLGRFAGAYRRLYGEYPSETLRKPARA